MSAIAESAVATSSIAEVPSGLVCELEVSPFDSLTDRATDTTFQHVGETVCYRPADGTQKYISAIIDREIGDIPGADVAVSQTLYEIAIKKRDVPAPARGDVVISIGGNYTLETLQDETDPFEWVWSARKLSS